MLNLKKQLPNFITSLNLFSGCIAITFAFQQDLKTAAYWIVLAAIFDFFDGLVARALNAYSELGKQLDSLADMVSFGVVPGIFVYQILLVELPNSQMNNYWAYAGFIIPVFSALRLANFNIDSRQSENFIGLPTPANTLFFISIPFIIDEYHTQYEFISNPLVLIALSCVMSFFMVAEIPLFSLKFKNFNIKENLSRFILVLSSAVLIFFLKFAAIPIIIFIYLFLSIIQRKKLINN